MTAHSHVRFQFRCPGNRSALTLKPHQKQTYLFRARSYIATHGVLLVIVTSCKIIDCSLKTAPAGAFPVNSHFRSKLAEHDVTLVSFVADL